MHIILFFYKLEILHLFRALFQTQGFPVQDYWISASTSRAQEQKELSNSTGRKRGASESVSFGPARKEGPKRSHKHKHLTSNGCWSPHYMANQNVGSSFVCGLWGPYGGIRYISRCILGGSLTTSCILCWWGLFFWIMLLTTPYSGCTSRCQKGGLHNQPWTTITSTVFSATYNLAKRIYATWSAQCSCGGSCEFGLLLFALEPPCAWGCRASGTGFEKKAGAKVQRPFKKQLLWQVLQQGAVVGALRDMPRSSGWFKGGQLPDSSHRFPTPILWGVFWQSWR